MERDAEAHGDAPADTDRAGDWSLWSQSLSKVQLMPWLDEMMDASNNKSVFSFHPKIQKVLQYPSHRILRYMHGALNVDEKKTNCTVWLEIARRTF